MIPKKALILAFFKAMFANKDVSYRGKVFPLKKIEGLRRFDVNNLLFIEQNPRKKTEWAKMAREGRKLMWIIDTKWNRYLIRVEDSNIIDLRGPSNGEK